VSAVWPLKALVGLAFIGSFCSMPLVTFLAVFAKDVFHRDAKGFSFLLAIFGVGAVCGAIGVAGFGHVRRKGILAVSMQMTFGALMAAFALSRIPALSYVLLFLCGACMMVIFAMFMTLVQENVADSMRGRVVSVYSLAFRGAMPLGNLTAAIATTLVPAPTVLVANGIILLTVGSIALSRRTPGGVTNL
jgi:predicted MFS family arabinose efflux permease